MFDIGFWELVVVGVVALIVVGPERLPQVARVLGVWLGKAQQTLRSVRKDIEDELHAEELRRTLAENLQTREIQNLVEETTASIKATGSGVSSASPIATPIDLSKNPRSPD
ncbi:MAG: Sec-independent protein translocase protein TatB [Methylococcales bacterium]